jgi:hypothetical protein
MVNIQLSIHKDRFDILVGQKENLTNVSVNLT